MVTSLVKECSACWYTLIKCTSEHLERVGSVKMKVNEIGWLNNTLCNVRLILCLHVDKTTYRILELIQDIAAPSRTRTVTAVDKFFFDIGNNI